MLLSVVIPALNEAGNLEKLLPYLRKILMGVDYEIIISDGGSTDGSASVSRYDGVKFIRSEQSRAIQMNAGAQLANGKYLYFLHADSYPPPDLLLYLKEMENTGLAAGCFRLKFDSHHPLLRFLGWCSRFDLDSFRYGDQSLLVSRELFEAQAGFDEKRYLMEGNELVKRLRKSANFRIFPTDILTSARKYRHHGVLYLQTVYVAVYLLGRWGWSQEKLMDFYKKRLDL